MRKTISLSLALMVLFCAWPILSAQEKPNLDLKIYKAIAEHEPEWRPANSYIIDNSLGDSTFLSSTFLPGRPPKGTIRLGDIWLIRREDNVQNAVKSGQFIFIHLYEVASRTEAAQSLCH